MKKMPTSQGVGSNLLELAILYSHFTFRPLKIAVVFEKRSLGGAWVGARPAQAVRF